MTWEQENARELLALAERNAVDGDLVRADELLKRAAALQEAELGPLHPDLAYTLNNRAVVAERAGRPNEAEVFYRRAASIASASLPADDPMVAISRQNLEDFCQFHGVAVETPANGANPPYLDSELNAFPAENASHRPPPEPPRPTEETVSPPAPAPPAPERTPPPVSSAPQPGIQTPPPTTDFSAEPTYSAEPTIFPEAEAAPRRTSALTWVAAIVAVIIGVSLFITRPWTVAAPPATTDNAAPAAPAAPEPAVPTPPPPAAAAAKPAPVEPGRPAANATRAATPTTIEKPPPAAGVPAAGAITLATASVCKTFSASGTWRCDAVGETAAPGQMVLYTRVRSARDATVVHRWYRGDALRQTVTLRIRANAVEGYRTYSRQTVDRGADWRVEVRGADNAILYEHRFAVQ